MHMNVIYSLPAFVKIGACFSLMLAMYRFKIGLGWSVLISTLLLTLMTGTGMDGFVYLARSFVAPGNFLMLLVIMMLTFFSDALSHTGRMEKAVNAFRGIFKDQRLLMGGLPAIIGLLPMPGGALFSAPFLASVDEKQSLSPEQKSAVNYWFRHIWEYWWPLYPGVILAIQYCGLPFGFFLLIQAPFTLASIAGGYVFLLRPLVTKEKGTAQPTVSLGQALQTLWPVGLLVLISVAASFLLPHAGLSAGMANLYGMLGGLCITLTLIFRADFATVKKSCRLFAMPSTWMLALVIAGVLAFSSVLQMPLNAQAHTLVSLMRDELIGQGIPIIIIIIILSGISGFVTGISAGFVGASFPIIFALIGPHPTFNTACAVTSLAFGSGYIGIMLSPVHLCYLMSNDYFKARLFPTYRYLLGPCAVIAGAMIIFCSIYFFAFK